MFGVNTYIMKTQQSQMFNNKNIKYFLNIVRFESIIEPVKLIKHIRYAFLGLNQNCLFETYKIKTKFIIRLKLKSNLGVHVCSFFKPEIS